MRFNVALSDSLLEEWSGTPPRGILHFSRQASLFPDREPSVHGDFSKYGSPKAVGVRPFTTHQSAKGGPPH